MSVVNISPAPFIGKLIKRGIQLRHKLNPRNISGSELQLKTLQTLLLHAGDTAFGKHYEFDKILSSTRPMRTFRDVVPIHDYNKMFEEWWHRTLAQESDVAWHGKMKYFALSSGTSGAPSKHIPVSEEMLVAMRRASLEMFLGVSRIPEVDPIIYTKQMLLVGSTISLTDKGDFYVGDLSGINAGQIPRWFQRYYKPGKKIALLPDYHSRIEEIAKNAHNWDIGVISGIPAWVQLMLERVIKEHGLNTIHDIWPNLQLYATGGVAFEPYKKGFEKLFARPITYLDTYLASEGFVGFQTTPSAKGMELVLGNGIYYEFIPFNEENFDSDGKVLPDAVALTLDEVHEGVDYALLLTTCAGAWRYLIGDTIRFTDVEQNEFIITGRTAHFLSITGEHLSVDNMNHGIMAMAEKFGLEIREFTAKGISYESLFAHRWYIGCDNPDKVDEATFSAALDEYLCSINDDYRTERKENALKAVFTHLIPSDLFYQWQEAEGKVGGQAKFPRVMKTDKFQQWEAFVKAKLNK